MKKNKVGKFYNQIWAPQKPTSFWDYERNRALPEFFLPTNKKEKVLDLACGNGQVAAYLKEQGYRIWGIDISSKAIALAKKLKGGKFRVGNVETKLPYKPFFFDFVFWGDGIEHVFQPEEVLNQIKKVLKPRGRLIISCPNIAFWVYRWHYFKTGSLASSEGYQCPPWQTGHIRFFNLKTLTQLLTKLGFRLKKIKGVSKSRTYNWLAKFWPNLFASLLLVEAESQQ